MHSNVQKALDEIEITTLWKQRSAIEIVTCNLQNIHREVHMLGMLPSLNLKILCKRQMDLMIG